MSGSVVETVLARLDIVRFVSRGRFGDEEGVAFWTGVAEDVGLDGTAAFFAPANEFVRRCGEGVSDAAFVDLLQETVLERGLDRRGRVLDRPARERRRGPRRAHRLLREVGRARGAALVRLATTLPPIALLIAGSAG